MKRLLSAFFLITVATIIGRLSFYKEPNITPAQFAKTPFEKDSITVATYNIHHGTDLSKNLKLKEMAMLVKDADIVFLSEVDRSYARRSKYQDQLTLFKNYTGHGYHVYAPTLEKTRILGNGSYGIAILSRYPIVDFEIIYLPTGFLNEPRAAIIAEVILKGHNVKILGTHLANIDQDRQRQLLKLMQINRGIDLILGDFNTRPPNVQKLIEHFDMTLANNSPTFPSHDPKAQIDYILYNKNFTLLTTQTIKSHYSDHLPVKASFAFKSN